MVNSVIPAAINLVTSCYSEFTNNISNFDLPFLAAAYNNEIISLDANILSESLFAVLYKIPEEGKDFYLPFNNRATIMFSFSLDEKTFRDRFNESNSSLNQKYYSSLLVLTDKKLSSSTGKIFERVFFNTLFLFSNKNCLVSELPFFLNQENIPSWCSTNFKINDIIYHNSPEEDFKFLNSFIDSNDDFAKSFVSLLISPSDKCGPDGLLILECNDNNYLEKKYIMFLIGIKYSLDEVKLNRRFDNENTTALDNLFQPVQKRIPLYNSITQQSETDENNVPLLNKNDKNDKSKNISVKLSLPPNEQQNENIVTDPSLPPNEQQKKNDTEDTKYARDFQTLLLQKLRDKVYVIHLCIEFDQKNCEPFKVITFKDNAFVFISSNGFFELLSEYNREMLFLKSNYIEQSKSIKLKNDRFLRPNKRSRKPINKPISTSKLTTYSSSYTQNDAELTGTSNNKSTKQTKRRRNSTTTSESIKKVRK